MLHPEHDQLLRAARGQQVPREAAEFVNLYSKSRGINRFPALIETLQWLRKRPEVRARKVEISIPQGLVDWIERETKLGNPALKEAVAATPDPDLRRALDWSVAVNQTVTDIVRGVPPFPFVRECLEELQQHADILVVSATPQEALEREWAEHDLTRYVVAICGQEMGTKKEALALARHYQPGQVLMVGDAPGDHSAAKANHTLFFPVNPGAEDKSWQRLFDEGVRRFLGGTFAGEYQQQLLAEFDRYLPSAPVACCGLSRLLACVLDASMRTSSRLLRFALFRSMIIRPLSPKLLGANIVQRYGSCFEVLGERVRVRGNALTIIGDAAASEWIAGPRRVLRVFPGIPLTGVFLPPGPGHSGKSTRLLVERRQRDFPR